jgi:hypothetical protein
VLKEIEIAGKAFVLRRINPRSIKIPAPKGDFKNGFDEN